MFRLPQTAHRAMLFLHAVELPVAFRLAHRESSRLSIMHIRFDLQFIGAAGRGLTRARDARSSGVCDVVFQDV